MAGRSGEQSWWVVNAAVLAGLAVFLSVMAVRHPVVACAQSARETVQHEEGDPAEVRVELKAWERMWGDIERNGVDALDLDDRVPGARYAGDTCGMRYRRLYRRVERETRERLVIAAFANDPETKKRILSALLDSTDPGIRGRTAIELARVSLRQGDAAEAEAALHASEGLKLPPACEADRHYLQGRLALIRRKPGAALDAFALANAHDPGYWNAWREQVPLLVRSLHDPDQGAAACLRHARRLIEVLGLLPQLANDTRQFAKLALSLERLGARSSATLLASGLTWRWAGQEAHGRSVLARALQAPEVLPRVCEGEMRARIARELEAA